MTPEQPYRGIARIPADEFPFELNDSMLPLKMVIRRLAFELHSATLGTEDPRPGDLVIEWSTAIRSTFDCAACGFGVLLATRLEWQTSDEEYDIQCTLQNFQDLKAGYAELTPKEHARNRMTETAWYIQYGPAPENVYRWVNAECMALPITVADLMEAKKLWP